MWSLDHPALRKPPSPSRTRSSGATSKAFPRRTSATSSATTPGGSCGWIEASPSRAWPDGGRPGRLFRRRGQRSPGSARTMGSGRWAGGHTGRECVATVVESGGAAESRSAAIPRRAPLRPDRSRPCQCAELPRPADRLDPGAVDQGRSQARRCRPGLPAGDGLPRLILVGIAMGRISDGLPRKKVMAFGLALWSTISP